MRAASWLRQGSTEIIRHLGRELSVEGGALQARRIRAELRRLLSQLLRAGGQIGIVTRTGNQDVLRWTRRQVPDALSRIRPDQDLVLGGIVDVDRYAHVGHTLAGEEI